MSLAHRLSPDPRPPVPTAPPALPLALLADVAGGLAAAEDLWRPHLRHDPYDRPSVRLLASDQYDAWLIGWTPGQQVELHDHGASAGALALIEGELREVTAHRGLLAHRTISAGDTVELPLGLVHDVVGAGAGPATSIHVYSPPLSEMSFYDATGRTKLRTVTVEGEEPVTDLRRAAPALHPARARRG